ncbi:MAG: hypothetical protein PPP55_12505 [Halorubrum sp.]
MSSETDADGGYVHSPSEPTTSTTDGDGHASDERAEAAAEPDGFGREGWALTGVLLTCVLVIPGVIYAYPYVAGSFGLTFFGTYLVLPLIPAVLLGLVAVWSMTAATPEE